MRLHANECERTRVLEMKRAKARRLREAVRRLVVAHRALDDARPPCGARLSLPPADARRELLNATAPMTTSDLESKLSIDRTNVSRLCIRMEKAGEIVRTKSSKDGRVRLLALTDHGEKLARQVDASSTAHFQELGQHLNAPRKVIAALEQLHTAMTALEAEAEEEES